MLKLILDWMMQQKEQGYQLYGGYQLPYDQNPGLGYMFTDPKRPGRNFGFPNTQESNDPNTITTMPYSPGMWKNQPGIGDKQNYSPDEEFYWLNQGARQFEQWRNTPVWG